MSDRLPKSHGWEEPDCDPEVEENCWILDWGLAAGIHSIQMHHFYTKYTVVGISKSLIRFGLSFAASVIATRGTCVHREGSDGAPVAYIYT